MGWCSATEIMDAALNGATQMVAHAWQIASGLEDAKTPALVNAFQERPALRAELDDVLRPFVATIAAKLRDGDWDCIEESDYFDRFRQEMLGYSDDQMIDWYRKQISEQDDPDRLREYAAAVAELMIKRAGGSIEAGRG
jgi:hypothetical protein